MTSIKNVALVGASGQLGAPILKALIDSGKFTITAVSRTGSKSTFPSGIKVVYADLASVSSLTTAFAGQDAVVSAVGNEGFLGQSVLFDASIAAGVKRFLPSEFGSDIATPAVAALPVFGYKVATRKYIEEKIAAGADITYSYVITGGFLDWGIAHDFLLATSDGKPKLYDGGDSLFSATSLASVGTAVVGVLSNLEETKNRSVYVQDIQTSQNQLLAIAKKAAPEKTFQPVTVKVSDVVKASYDALAKGDYGMGTMVGFLTPSLFGGRAYGMPMEKIDNELLGVKGKSEADLEAIFKAVFAERG